MTAISSDDDLDTRPSLMADWREDGVPQTDGLRMLGGLESAQRRGGGGPGVRGARRERQHRTPRWLVVVLLLATVSVGAVFVSLLLERSAARPLAWPRGEVVVVASSGASSAASAPVVAEAAVIENTVSAGMEATHPVAGAPSPLPASSAAQTQHVPPPFTVLDGLDPQTARQWQASRQEMRASGVQVSRAEPALMPGAASASVAPVPLAQRGETAVTSKVVMPSASQAEPSAANAAAKLTLAQRRKAAREADAALLRALVAHVSTHSRQEVTGAMPAVRPAGGKGPAMTTIAQIVGYCRTLHGEEAKQCRVQICENYWGKDDACSTRPAFHKVEGH